MDKEMNCLMYEAFHFGARATLDLEGKQITNQQLEQLKGLLREIAESERTLHDLGAEAMQAPDVSEIIARVGPLGIRRDKNLAGQILQFWK